MNKQKCPSCEAEGVEPVGPRGPDCTPQYKCGNCQKHWWEEEWRQAVQDWLAAEELWQNECSNLPY